MKEIVGFLEDAIGIIQGLGVLMINRRCGESMVIHQDGKIIAVIRVKESRGEVRLRCDVDKSLQIDRGEVYVRKLAMGYIKNTQEIIQR